MKILVITPNLDAAGGVSTYWNSLFPVLKTYKDLEIDNLEIGGHGKNIFSPLIDQWKLYQKLKKDYDLILINPSLGIRSFFRDGIFAKQCIKKQVPFFIFFHGWDVDFQNKVNKKYKSFFMNSFGKAKNIFVLSIDFKNKILEWGYDGDVIVETTNIDKKLIKNFSIDNKLEKMKNIKQIKILFLARLFKEKGIFELIDAFEILQKKYHHIELTIAGDGKDYHRVEERIKDNRKINAVGHVDGEKKIELFNNSHIYCLPSYSEGLPTSVLEAMVFGLPIITTRVGGLKNFFQNEKMGYFIKVQNIKDLVDRIEYLLLNMDKSINIGNYNYNYAKNKLLNTVVADRMYNYIITIIK
jgi:glycosyltransferase involved in cell wall biosynthesis